MSRKGEMSKHGREMVPEEGAEAEETSDGRTVVKRGAADERGDVNTGSAEKHNSNQRTCTQEREDQWSVSKES